MKKENRIIISFDIKENTDNIEVKSLMEKLCKLENDKIISNCKYEQYEKNK